MKHLSPMRLAARAGRPLSAGEARHLSGCAECARALLRVEVAARALADVAALAPPELSPVAEARAEASIRWTRAPSRPVARPAFLVGFGVAALLAAFFASRRSPAVARWQPARVTPPAPAAPSADKPLMALVTLVGGEVELSREGRAQRLGLDSVLAGGDRVTTKAGGRAAAQWAEGSGFLLYGDSEMTLSRLEPRTQRLGLVRGRVSVRVGRSDLGSPSGATHAPGESLEVRTPEHVIRVHGTWFNVATVERGTQVEVLEGTVEVTDLDGAASTMLTAPSRATFGRGHSSSLALSSREAMRLRGGAEMNLSPWAGLDAARAASGALTIASRPPAELAVDGVYIGATPLAVRRTVGRHLVELSRPGFVPQRHFVTVGKEPDELRLALPRAPLPEPDTAPVEMESMVKRRGTQIRTCYERRLKRDPQLSGTVSLRLSVGSAGQVTRVAVEESTIPDPLVAECLKREAAGWSFAVGRNATVVYPFVFRAQ